MIITSKHQSADLSTYQTNKKPVDFDPSSWQLAIFITEPNLTTERTLRVHGDTHIGGVIFQLVESLPSGKHDWSGFALWWPQQNQWLTRTKQTLDQYNVQADAKLQFTRTHRSLKIQLPDLQVFSLTIDHSVTMFNSVRQVCKQLGLRHPEEVSLVRATCLDSQRLVATATSLSTGGTNVSTLNSARNSRHSSEPELGGDTLVLSPYVAVQAYLSKWCSRFKGVADKAKVNGRWLDSSLSLMEQKIGEGDLVQLRFKYFAFYELSAKLDSVRINQIYEQAKWAVLSEEIEATEQELINFAALQLHTQLQSKNFLNSDSEMYNTFLNRSLNEPKKTNRKFIISENATIYDDDDVDTALNKLELSLEVTQNPALQKPDQPAPNNNTKSTYSTETPNDFKLELAEELLLQRSHKLSFKKFKSFFFVLDNTCYLSYFKSKEDSINGRPFDKICLKGCELVPDVNVSQKKFGINLKVPSSEGMTEMCLRCTNEESYARWLSACKLASRNKMISEQAYNNETNSILNLLQLQQNKFSSDLETPQLDKTMSLKSGDSKNNYVDNENIQACNLLPLRMLKKHKAKQLNDKILEAYSAISHLDLYESKWHYIKLWQTLPSYGVSYFTVKMKGSRHKEEIIGVTSNRLMRINSEGETTKTWRFNTMKSWNVNWENKQLEVIFDEELVVFTCVNFEPKILHEFIGGYIYMSLRSPDKAQQLDEDMFMQLTEKR